MTSLYDHLGIKKGAKTEDIKKAFRKLSMEYHPDRPNGNEKKYKEINNAYDILSDDEKRKRYDMEQSMEGMGMNGRMGGDMGDIFNMMFGGQMRGMPVDINDIFNGGGGPNIRIFHNGRPVHVRPQKPSPVKKVLVIPLEDAYKGTKKQFEIERWIQRNRMKLNEIENLYVDIPRGIDNNEIIVIKEKGNMIDDTLKGDIKVHIQIKPHPIFKRRGLDLILEKTITFKESICGFKFEMKHIDGKTYSINNLPGKVIYSGFKKTIPNLGMFRDKVVGNLIIEFKVSYPDELTNEQAKEIEKIL